MHPRILVLLFVLTILVLSVIVLTQWFSPVQSSRLVLGIPYLLFVPGFVWTLVIFPRRSDKDQIDWVERTALSLALSLFTIPILIFVFNLLGVRITAVSILLETLAVIVTGLIVLVIRNAQDRYKTIRGAR